MAVVGQVASSHEDHACASSESFKDKVTVYPSRTHYSYSSKHRWILKAASSSKVSACVTTPVAKETQYFLFWVIFQGCLNLVHYLRIGKVHLSDCVCRTFCNAGATAVARGRINLGRLSLWSCGSTVGTCFHAYATFRFGVSAFVWVHHGDDGFDFPSGLRKDGGGSCCSSASLRHAVRDVLRSLTGSS